MEMPANLTELGDWWEGMDKNTKRLVLFAPNAYPWDDLCIMWDNVFHFPVEQGCGLYDVDYSNVLELLLEI